LAAPHDSDACIILDDDAIAISRSDFLPLGKGRAVRRPTLTVNDTAADQQATADGSTA
jgi:hypothetical protein